MGKRWIILALLLIAVVVITAALLAPPKAPPLAVSFVDVSRSFDGLGMRNRARFTVTNCTDKPIVAVLEAIEIMKEGRWSPYAQDLDRAFSFLAKNNGIYTDLQPHRSAYAIFDNIDVPTSGVWRLRVSVDTPVAGLPALWENLKRVPDAARFRAKTGSTNSVLDLSQVVWKEKWFVTAAFTNTGSMSHDTRLPATN